MNKPIIGITCGEIQNKIEPWSPITYGQSRTYIDVVVASGGVPLLIPICPELTVLAQLYALCNGILFTGGNDVDPHLYGKQADEATADVSGARDTQELLLLDWTLRDDKPLFGICRGMQLLNVKRGGSLYQDIATSLPNASDHESSTKAKSLTHTAHTLKLQTGSLLATAAGTTSLATNSHHHQAISKIGDSLIATAWSEDGLVEAIEDSSQRFVVGVQSHPESLTVTVPAWQKVFEAFIAAA